MAPGHTASTSLFLFSLLMAGTIVSLSAGHQRHAKPACQMPPFSDLQRRLSALMGLHDSFYQYPPLLKSAMTLEKFRAAVKEGMVDVKYSFLTAGRKTCENSDFNMHVNSSAMPDSSWEPCPLVWKINSDQHRQPRDVLEAECLTCDLCSKVNTSDFTMGCAPVRYFTKVLRRTGCCESGVYQYVEVWEPITVGCACRPGGLARAGGMKAGDWSRPADNTRVFRGEKSVKLYTCS